MVEAAATNWAWGWPSDKVSDLNTAGEGALYDFVVFLRLGVCRGRLHLDLVVPANVLPICGVVMVVYLISPRSRLSDELDSSRVAFSLQLVFVDHPFGREVTSVSVDAEALSR
jgi:hypothetical protein